VSLAEPPAAQDGLTVNLARLPLLDAIGELEKYCGLEGFDTCILSESAGERLAAFLAKKAAESADSADWIRWPEEGP
jgi:hypothetical protein